VKIVHLHTLKAYRRSRCILQFIHNLGTRWFEWSASNSISFTLGGRTLYQLNGKNWNFLIIS